MPVDQMSQEVGMQGEQSEDAGLQQILQICQSAQDPSGYQQIAEIVQGLLSHNQEEEGEMQGSEAAPEDMAGKVMERIKKNRGE